MKRTLLQVVQSYLNRTSGFYVNSVFETDESQQAAEIVEEVYYEMAQEFPNLLFLQKDRTLDSVSDVARPTFLLIPSEFQNIKEAKILYNTAREDQGETLNWEVVNYLPPLDFLAETQLNYNDKDPNTEVIEGFDKQKILIGNKEFPTYCTSFDDKYITFNSYHKDYDTTLQASKSRVIATEMPSFLQEDDFLIPVPEHLSETFLVMCLAELYSSLRQENNVKLDQRARRARIKLQQDNRVLGSSGRAKTKYGRRAPVGTRRRAIGVSDTI